MNEKDKFDSVPHFIPTTPTATVTEEPPIRWIDTHCHLEMIDDDPEAIMRRAAENNVPTAVSIGTERKSNAWLAETATKLAGVSVTLGIHPHYADGATGDDLRFIRENLELPGVVGLGECGLDYHYGHSEAENQLKVFREQMRIAAEKRAPTVIHTRNAEEDTMAVLREFDGEPFPILLHCFTSNEKLAEFGRERGYYFSFNGIATYPKSEDVRSVLLATPKNRILLETDAPYLSPRPVRGKKNEPAHLALTGEILAGFLGVQPAELARINRENAAAFYRNFEP